MDLLDFPPHPLFPSGHLQTLAGFLLFRGEFPETAERHLVLLDDGDRIVLHDDRPAYWQSGDRVALLLHGLAAVTPVPTCSGWHTNSMPRECGRSAWICEAAAPV